MTSILKLMPQEYLHVENTDTCDVVTLVGPITFTMYDHHRRLHNDPRKLVVVPPGHYVEVKNPLHRVDAQPPAPQDDCENSNSSVSRSSPVYLLLHSNTSTPTGIETVQYSRWKSPYGSSELRFADDSPFPLLPDEEVGDVLPMPLLTAREALVLEAVVSHTTTEPRIGAVRHRVQQERYLFRGPGVYRPRLDERVVDTITGRPASSMQVYYFTAQYDFVDDDGVSHVAGEKWMQRAEGLVFPHPAVKLDVRDVCIVAETEAVEFESSMAFFDETLNVQREAKQPYIITHADTTEGVYVPRHYERLLSRRYQLHLSSTQYCVVVNPVGADGRPAALREAEVRVGKQSFLLQPGEKATAVLDALVLREDEALLLIALHSYTEVMEQEEEEEGNTNDVEATRGAAAGARSKKTVLREGGSRWLVRGPRQFIPPIYARVVERRRMIQLDENSGVYVRNIYTGQVRSVFGKPFMLSAEEELWARPVSAYMRRLLAQPRQSLRVDDMSGEEIAEAAVEEGRANIRCLNDATQSTIIAAANSAINAIHRASVTQPNAAAAAAGRQRLAHPASSTGTPEDSEEDGDDSDVCTVYTKDDTSAVENSDKSKTNETDPYATTLNLLQIAENNAHPPCQSSDIAQFHVLNANVEHNTLMRLYDTSSGRSRVVAGPATVHLEPHEYITPLSLSGGRPKKPHQIHSLSLYLGPDYMADVIEVETRDHARLLLHLAYNWEFDGVESGSETGVDAQLAFTIPDFVGQACKALASRIRSVIAGKTFEFFHRNSSTLIRQAIFTSASSDGSTVVKDGALLFTANGFRITTVDVQSVTPVDTKTRIALTKSVQLAVEIITKSQESDASHQAALLEQEANGALELQVMRDRAKAEQQRMALLKVMGDNMVLEQAGASRAQALAENEARLAEAQGEVDATPIRCAAHSVSMDAELDVLRQRAELDLTHRAAMNKLAEERLRRLASIEAAKYEQIMSSLGKETLIAIANAGPELKAQLLGTLGLQGFIVTDGSTPINMLNFADQIVSRPASV